MFKMKNMGAIASLLGRREEISKAAEELADRVMQLRIEGIAGGGACRVILTGKQRVESVTLDPAVCLHMGESPEARTQAEQLIKEATNDALEKCQKSIREMVEDEIKRLGLEDLIPVGATTGLGTIGKLLG